MCVDEHVCGCLCVCVTSKGRQLYLFLPAVVGVDVWECVCVSEFVWECVCLSVCV